jgi:FkbM family methyltransferase
MKDLAITVHIKDDVSICVPNDIGLITPYVLLEQEDWFEDEIKFVRKILKPGMQVVDIGANYGTYTLTAANKVGPQGKVWAFEPSSKASNFLATSIGTNNFRNVDLIKMGLSDKCGEALLGINANEELNAVVDRESKDKFENCERIELASLDRCMERYGWNYIDFVKIDAEGHEKKIIEGGKSFLNSNSPLVMYEIKAGDQVNLDLTRQFKLYGYESYKLIPGLNALAPFSLTEKVDGYQLNLFCCKDDRKETLKQSNLLIDEPLTRDIKDLPEDAWSDYLLQFPYAKQMWNRWRVYCQAPRFEGWEAYKQALNNYAMTQNHECPLRVRYGYLKRAYEGLLKLAEGSSNLSRLQSFIRVATDLGHRENAVSALRYLAQSLKANQSLAVIEPFLPLSHSFQDIDVGDKLGNWMATSILEQYEKLRAFSSYYTGRASLEAYELLTNLGFQTPELERRRQLVRMCNKLQEKPRPNALLAGRSPDNLNPGLWN